MGNTKDQFVNIVRSHESIQPNMNSVLKLVTKTIEELSQPHVKSDGTQHTKARLREVLKEKWKNKVMHGQYIRNIDIDSSLVKKTRSSGYRRET